MPASIRTPSFWRDASAGREALLSFRMNDDHGNDFLRTQFRVDHPDCRLGAGALDFGQEAVREYVFRLIEEAVARYDCEAWSWISIASRVSSRTARPTSGWPR